MRASTGARISSWRQTASGWRWRASFPNSLLGRSTAIATTAEPVEQGDDQCYDGDGEERRECVEHQSSPSISNAAALGTRAESAGLATTQPLFRGRICARPT